MVIRVQEQFEELPTVRRGRVDNPMRGTTAGDITARQSQDMGRALQGASSGVAEIVQQEQAKANKLRLQDIYNEATLVAHDLQYNKDSGYRTKKGSAALDGIVGDDGVKRSITDSYGSKLDKAMAGMRAKIGNDAVAQQFDLVIGDLKTNFRKGSMTYEAEQSAVYATEVSNATIMTAANLAATDPFGSATQLHLAFASEAARVQATRAGLEGPAHDQAVQAVLGKMHSAVVSSLIEGKDIGGAKKYFDLHKGDLGGLELENLQAKVDTAYGAFEAMVAVDEVMTAMPLVRNRPTNTADMKAALRARFGDNVAGYKAANAELEDRISAHEAQEREQNASSVSEIYKRSQAGESMASLEGSGAWLALPGDMRETLKNNLAARRENIPISDEAWGDWLGLMMDPTALLDATGTQIAAMEPFYGRSLTLQLSNRSASLKAARDGDAQKALMAPPKIDTDLFQSVAASYGLPAYSDSLNDGERKRLATFRHQIEDMVAKNQAATQKIIPPAEMAEFVRKAAAQIKSPGYAAAYWTSGLTSEQKGKLAFALPAAGTPESQAIARYLQSKNLPPTVENQRRAVLDLNEASAFMVDE